MERIGKQQVLNLAIKRRASQFYFTRRTIRGLSLNLECLVILVYIYTISVDEEQIMGMKVRKGQKNRVFFFFFSRI